MPERVWYRSLYWRIAAGIIGLLVVILVVQVAVFLWLLSRTPDNVPPRVLQQTARALAVDLETSLVQDPWLDLQRFVDDRAEAISRPVVLVWGDGRVVWHGVDEPPRVIVQVARARLGRLAAQQGPAPPPPTGGVPLEPGGAPAESGGPPADRGNPDAPMRRVRAPSIAVVRVAGQATGVVAVLPGPPLRTLLRDLGPILFAVAAALSIGGTALAALLVFGPAHRRLRGLESAARSLGAGDAAARAPDDGGDEIAAVAQTFNSMAAEIVSRAEALQASDRARRQLLADVSHELMTPLTAMRGYLETLRLPDLPIDARARERYLDIVLEETLRMERLIGDLLDLARLEAGGPSFSEGRVRVADLFDRVRSRHDQRVQQQDVLFSSSIGPGAEALTGDADRLEQALQNLAANALRHVTPGGHVSLEAVRQEDGRACLRVKDDGPGIPPEHLPYVFDRFYKADASRDAASGGGSGLGLSIVKAIAQRHGGVVRARSDPGRETVFEIVLPATRVAPAAPATSLT